MVGEDAEGKLDGHCVACYNVDREAGEEEDQGVDEDVEVEVCPGGPSLRAGQGDGILAEDGCCEHFLRISVRGVRVVVQAPTIGWILCR